MLSFGKERRGFLRPAFGFHGIIVVNLFCYSFLLEKGKNNFTCTAYHS